MKHAMSIHKHRVLHLAPNKDMPSRSAQAESFSLANMVPQVHASNAGVWEGMEGAARQMALDEGEVYVVSGPAFIGNNVQRVGNVLVPTHLWKVLYSPAQQRAGAYVTANDATGTYSMGSVSELEKMTGVSVLPGLPRSIRDSAMALPKPAAQHGGKKSRTKGQSQSPSKEADDFTLRDFATSILDAIKRAGQH